MRWLVKDMKRGNTDKTVLPLIFVLTSPVVSKCAIKI